MPGSRLLVSRFRLARQKGSGHQMIEQLKSPVVAAPMAGGVSNPDLVSEVGSAGGLGFLAAGYLDEEALAEQISSVRGRGVDAFGVNLFVPHGHEEVELADYEQRVKAEARAYGVQAGTPHWDDDQYQAKVELVLTAGVPVVSFTFGVPAAATVRRLHSSGTQVVVTVTTPDEARLAAEVGADVLCVQGAEAGGHRSVFADDGVAPGGGTLYGLLAALRLISSTVDTPLLAAGGLVHGQDLAAVLAAGALAGQFGTAFAVCDEASTSEIHRREIAAGERETTLTRAFSGRPARGLVNRFLNEHSAHAPAAYPQLHHLTKTVRAAAKAQGDPEGMSLWAGQTYSQTRPMPAAELVSKLAAEARAAVRVAATRLGT